MRAYTQAARWVRAAASWHVGSVAVARRNALVASTALAQRRRELDEVEEFLAAHRARRETRRTVDAGVAAAGHRAG